MTDRLEKLYTADPTLPDAIARALWLAGTSEDSDISSSRSATYLALEMALQEVLWHVFHLTTNEARHARDLLSEYGPDDKLTGTSYRGIHGYAEFAMANKRKAY